MGGLLFSGAFLIVVVVLGVRATQAWARRRKQIDHHAVARFDDVDVIVGRARCACGRKPDKDGEGPRKDGAWGVELSCVCGRTRSLVFQVAN